jgi:hypothetical protein
MNKYQKENVHGAKAIEKEYELWYNEYISFRKARVFYRYRCKRKKYIKMDLGQ